MDIEKFCSQLERQLVDRPEREVTAAAVEAICRNFSIAPESVALLRFNADRGGLEFLWPLGLRNAQAIPLSARDSLAARTAHAEKAFTNNRFAAARHAAVFEAITIDPKREARPLPIQKILSAPLPLSGAPGVIQLVRLGLDPEAAGPDFGRRDVDALSRLTEVIARYLD